MRMPNGTENLIGKIAVNSVGRVAIITGTKTFEWGVAWVGIGFDGKGTWASSEPCVVAESAEEFRETLSTRFGGKMAYNG